MNQLQDSPNEGGSFRRESNGGGRRESRREPSFSDRGDLGDRPGRKRNQYTVVPFLVLPEDKL